MSIEEVFVIFLLIVVFLKPNQQKMVIQKLKQLYKQILRYKQTFQQTINNKVFCKIGCVENSKKTKNIVDYDPFTDNFIPNIKNQQPISKNKHKLVKSKSKNKKFSTKQTKPTK